jgi:hypothetical protein
MDPKETIQALMDAVQAGDFEKARSFLVGGFFSDASLVSMVLTWHWTNIGEKLKEAFPDLDYGLHIESVDESVVKFSTQIRGTHTRDLALTMLTTGVIPATNKTIASPREYGIAVVRAGKVISWAMEKMNCTNLTTILAQLGIKEYWQLLY